MAAPPVPVTFMKSPWEEDVVINFSTPEGRKLFTTSISPILPTFEGKQEELLIFLSHIKDKGAMLGWNESIFKINIGTAAAPIYKSLVTQHGQITIAQCQAKATAFLAEAAGNRETQLSNMFRMSLVASISNDVYTKLMMRESEYTIVDHAGNNVEDGATMLMVMIAIVSIETRSTVSLLRAKLRALPDAMNECGSDIQAFNVYVNKQILALNARGETTQDLLTSLFSAYLVAENTAFVAYITDLESKYEDGTTATLSATELMVQAEDKYKTMVEKKTWEIKTKEQKQFMALKTEFEDYKMANKQATSAPVVPRITRADKRTKTPKGDTTHTPTPPRGGKWKHVAPKAGEPTHKKVGEKEFVYCPHHGDLKWVLKSGHIGGCTKAPDYDKASDAAKTAKYARALAHIHEQDDEDEESDVEDENL